MRTAWPFSRSLLYPLTAILVALAVLPVALVGYGFVSSNRDQVSTLEKQYLTRQAVGMARELHLVFLDSIGRIDTVARALRPAAGGRIELDTASAILTEVARSNSNILLIRLLDSRGEGPYVQGRQLSPRAENALDQVLGEAFAANLRGRAVRRDVYRIPGQSPVALVSLPLTARNGTVLGALQGVVSLEWVASRVAEESSRGMTVDVVGSNGEVLFSSERQRVGVSARVNPLVSQFLQAPVRLTKTYRDPLLPRQDEVLGSLCPVEGPSWAVIAARDVRVAFAGVRLMAERTAVLSAVAGLLAMGAGVLLARRITLPLRHLAGVTAAVAAGDFARRVPVTSRNEMGQLAGNFNVMAEEIEEYVTSLRQALRENQQLLVDSIRALAAAIDAKSPYTRGHSERVSQYAVTVANTYGISPEDVKRLEIAALLHDIGKIGIEDAILQKPGKLTAAEYARMQDHPLMGSSIVSSIRNLRDMLPGIRSHHENWAGGGYPDGLKGEDIPVIARIIAAADVFDAMTTNRPYQQAMSLDIVFQRMREMAGGKLEPAVVDAFFAAVRAGELVPLGRVEVA